jgi:DNA polymerase-3 subunit delta
MSAIRNHEADRFIAEPPAGVAVFLVFGSDSGLVSERVQQLIKASVDDPGDPFQLIRLQGDAVAADPLRLADEAATIPLFGGRRAIVVEAGSKSYAAAIEPVLERPPTDCRIILSAGALKKDAPLRRLVERSGAAAAIECYPDDAMSLERLIEAEARAGGLRLDPEARQALLGLLGADRLATRSELGKLLLYAHGREAIDLAAIEAIVTDASSVSLDAAVDGAFGGDYRAIDATAERLYADGGEPVVLLAAALRQAILLHRAKLEMVAGRSAGEALEALRGRFFFKRKALVERHLRQWSAERLLGAIGLLAATIGRARREPRLAGMLTVRALWSLARAARSQVG